MLVRSVPMASPVNALHIRVSGAKMSSAQLVMADDFCVGDAALSHGSVQG